MKKLVYVLMVFSVFLAFDTGTVSAQNILVNGDFEDFSQPLEGWSFYTNGGGSFRIYASGCGAVGDFVGRVSITGPTLGTNVQLYQENIPLDQNTRYKLTFRAWSNSGHNSGVSLIKHTTPYTNYGLNQTADLTANGDVCSPSTWDVQTFEFTTSGFTGTVNDGRLMFWFPPYAQVGDQFHFDDIVLEKVATPWAKTYGSSGYDDHARSIQQTSDGGYIVAGDTYSGNIDVWILKLNANGSIAWQTTYGGGRAESADSIQQTADGGFIVAGFTDSFGAGSNDAWILKLNANGAIVWQKTYGGGGNDGARSIQQTGDGGFIVAGWIDTFSARSYDVWILKLDADGSIAWQKTYGGDGAESVDSIQQTGDGGFIVAGQTLSFGAGSRDAWILKLDADGSIAWQKTYGGSGNDVAQSIQQTGDGGFIVAGAAYSFGAGSRDAWILKLNADGSIAWQKTYSSNEQDYPHSIQQTGDGGFIVAGYTQTCEYCDYLDFWIMKLNVDGSIAWQKTYGGSDWDAAFSVQQTSDGGFIVAGDTRSFGDGSTDFWILKLDSNGNCGDCPAAGVWDAVAASTASIVMDTNASAMDADAEVYDSNLSSSNTSAVVRQICPVLITNPGFETGTTPWLFWTDGAGIFATNAAGPASPKAAHVTITTPGNNVQLYQDSLTLEANTKYWLSFKAYSNSGHDVMVSMLKHGSPYTNYGLSGQVFNLTNAWAEYSVEFTTKNFTATVGDGRLMLWLAPYDAAGDQYFFDDVMLTKVP